jgi:hypothetical protein
VDRFPFGPSADGAPAGGLAAEAEQGLGIEHWRERDQEARGLPSGRSAAGRKPERRAKVRRDEGAGAVVQDGLAAPSAGRPNEESCSVAELPPYF